MHVEIRKGMYGLPKNGLLAHELLDIHLNKHGYHQSKQTPDLWSHKTMQTQFALVVNNLR